MLADLKGSWKGAAKRLRPKFTTVATMFVGLIPIMWATGTGSDLWKRIAAPMVGGISLLSSSRLVVYTAVYEIWKWHFQMKHARAEAQPDALTTPAVARGNVLSVDALRRISVPTAAGDDSVIELGRVSRSAGLLPVRKRENHPPNCPPTSVLLVLKTKFFAKIFALYSRR